MEETNSKNVHEKITAYNLLDELKKRLKVKRVGGVANSTLYKAFQCGGTTPLLRLVIDTSLELIAEHESGFEPEAEAA